MSKEKLSAALKRLSMDQSYIAYSGVSNLLETEGYGLSTLKLALLRNFTLEPLVPVLKGEIALAGFHPLLYLGGYDTIAKDVLDSSSEIYAFNPDLVFVFQWLETLAPQLVTRFVSLSESRVVEEIDRVVGRVLQFIVGLRNNINAPIIVNNFVLPAFPAFGILDAQSATYQMHAIVGINVKLREIIRKYPDVYVFDMMGLMARIGSEQGVDERYWQLSRAPIGRNALVPVGREYGKFVRALFGRVRKCLVLDCDNVLWNGIVGEEGIKSVNVSFQTEVLNLLDRGVILALCSKNNEEDVINVVRNHPEMVLREQHIAARQINWDDKATNLVRIAEELNIGIDSLVFLDDSLFECDLVRDQLPQVAVMCLAGEMSLFSLRLQEQGYFDALTISKEDGRRNQIYREESERKRLVGTSGSMAGYLASLGMVAEIGLADDGTIPRIAQLSQKTNQFNLTTRRYTESGVRRIALDSGFDVVYLKLRDHVSDLGLVGVAVVEYRAQVAVIDTLLVSCRALGRGVEDALMVYIMNAAHSRGCQQMSGRYIKTDKNGQVSNYFQRLGFDQSMQSDQWTDWSFSLERKISEGPEWVKVNIVSREVENAG